MHKLLFGAFLSGLLISFAACSEDEAKLTNSYQYFPGNSDKTEEPNDEELIDYPTPDRTKIAPSRSIRGLAATQQEVREAKSTQ